MLLLVDFPASWLTANFQSCMHAQSERTAQKYATRVVRIPRSAIKNRQTRGMSFLSPSLKLENLPREPIMSQDHLAEAQRYQRRSVVATWWAPVKGRMYHIELEHGPTSGRRMIWVNGQEVLRHDWMFKLVGQDTFHIDGCRCIVTIEPAPGFKYRYSLHVDGDADAAATEDHREYRLWRPIVDGREYRVMAELNSLQVYIDDRLSDSQCEFVDGGTDSSFHVADDPTRFVLQTRNGDGLVQTTLLVNGSPVPEWQSQENLHETHASILCESD